MALLPVPINEGDIERRVFLKGTPQKGNSSCCWGRGNRPHSLKLPASIKELSPHAAYYFAHCWPLSMPLINDCTQCTVFYFFVMWDTPWQAKHSIWKLAMLEYPRYGATQSTNLQTCHTKFCYSATSFPGREGSPIFFFASHGALWNQSPSAPTSPSSGKPLPFFDFRQGMGMDLGSKLAESWWGGTPSYFDNVLFRIINKEA